MLKEFYAVIRRFKPQKKKPKQNEKFVKFSLMQPRVDKYKDKITVIVSLQPEYDVIYCEETLQKTHKMLQTSPIQSN